MKVAISMGRLQDALLREELSTTDFLKYAASLGIDGVELVDGNLDFRTLKTVLRETGLDLVSYVFDHDFSQPVEKERLIRSMELAAELGAHSIQVKVGKWVAEGLTILLPLAEQLGVTICIENPGRTSRESVSIAKLLTQFASPYLKHSFHMANYWLGGENLPLALERLEKYSIQIRISDLRLAHQDELISAVKNHHEKAYVGSVLGLGEVPVQELLKILSAREYDGWIIVEFTGLEEPRFGMEASLKNLRQFLARTIVGGRAIVSLSEVDGIILD